MSHFADDIAYLSLSHSAQLIRAGELSPIELTESLLRRIERLEPRLNAFVTIAAESAVAQAKAATESLAAPATSRNLGPLHGVPIALKDLYDVAGLPTTAGSGSRIDHVAEHDAYTVSLMRRAGAIFLGKTQTHEWAFGTTTNNPHFGPARNPWHLDRIPGGSSGGNAVGLAAGMFAGCLGSDTGGSIRIPAALCGIVGLKPTQGRVSLSGVMPLSWTLDHAGPMARTVADAALLTTVIEGYDPSDPSSELVPAGDSLDALDPEIEGLRIGIPSDYFWDDLNGDLDSLVRQSLNVLSDLGAALVELPRMDWAETFRASGRMLVADAAAVHREGLESFPEQYGDDIVERLNRGATVPGPQYAEARRSQAIWIRRLSRTFDDVDLIATPTTPEPARTIDTAEGVATARILTSLTAPFNLTGAPAISVPCGFTSEGLPVGLQLVAPWWKERRLLRAALAYEGSTPWSERRPNLDVGGEPGEGAGD